MDKEFFKRAIEHSPAFKDVKPFNPELIGEWHHDASGDLWICRVCGSRLAGRGISTNPTTLVWEGQVEPIGVCVCCGK